jgi:hypothetical protein
VRRANDLYWIILDDESMVADVSSDYPESTINKNEQITNLITN